MELILWSAPSRIVRITIRAIEELPVKMTLVYFEIQTSPPDSNITTAVLLDELPRVVLTDIALFYAR